MSVTIQILPSRPALRQDVPTEMDILVRLSPHLPDVQRVERPALNLGLVLDRSGSMADDKIEYARRAAMGVVEQLLPTDRVSVTVFDNEVQVLVPSTLAEPKQAILERISSIQVGGSTALFAGWQAGAQQVQEHLQTDALNRVLLLTDGQANVGLVIGDAIATEVKQASLRGVTTSTLGIGRDYNEDLLQIMGQAGDGNYYFINSPQVIHDIFQTELRGLAAQIGREVRLALKPTDGVEIEVLNDLPRDPEGSLMLGTLVGGVPTFVVARLRIPAMADTTKILSVHLSWIDSNGSRQHQQASLLLPAVTSAAWEQLDPDASVVEQATAMQAARLKRELSRCLDRHDVSGARDALLLCESLTASIPESELASEERADVERLRQLIENADYVTSNKLAKFRAYSRSSSKPRTEVD